MSSVALQIDGLKECFNISVTAFRQTDTATMR